MRLLLDVHISSDVVDDLRSQGVDAVSVADHQDGALREADDNVLLETARQEGRVCVTYDVSTIPLLLAEWAEQERPHAGVVLIHHRTIPQGDHGLLLRSLVVAIQEWSDLDWTNRCVYLRRAGGSS